MTDHIQVCQILPQNLFGSSRLIAENLWADDTNRPTPPPPLSIVL